MAGPVHAVFVLGMHRSGTSAMAGLLHHLGVDLGPDLMPPNPYNERGHWEHAGIVAVHDRLLASLGSAWDDPCPLPEGWWNGEGIAPYTTELRAIVRRDFQHRPLWGLKDPRLCRLQPLWPALLSELGATPAYVVMVREPAEIAASLQHRDGFDPAHSLLVWLENQLTAERHTRDALRAFVTYDDLLRDWRAVAECLQQRFALAWPVPPAAAASAVDRFLSPTLRHHAGRPAPEAPAWATRLYMALAAATGGDDAPLVAAVSALAAELAGARTLLRPSLAQLRRDHAAALSQRVAALRAETDAVRQESETRAMHLRNLEAHLHTREALITDLTHEAAARAAEVHRLDAERTALACEAETLRAEVARLTRARDALGASVAGRLLLRLARPPTR